METIEVIRATVSERAERKGLATLLRSYWLMIRPGIVAMVLFTMAVPAVVLGGHQTPVVTLLNALLGAGLVIMGAIALNQRLESRSDALMPRTANRVLPSGRLSDRHVAVFGIVTTTVGLAYLAMTVGWTIAGLTLVSWVIYVWIYTPLKVFTAWQTPIGSIAGAMPTLLGAAAVGDPFRPESLALFGVVYFWQFPHAMAIAWLYRDQFAKADSKVATVVDPSGRTAAWAALIGALLLLPVSLLLSPLETGGFVAAGSTLLAGSVYLAASFAFLRDRNDRSARRLLRVSLIYLPAVFLVFAVGSFSG